MRRYYLRVVGVLLAVVASTRADEFDSLRQRWQEFQVGSTNLDLTDLDVTNHLAYLASTATQYWTNMLAEAGRTSLWNDTAAWTNRSTYITTDYIRLRTMAQAWAARGSSLEGNTNLLAAIVGGLDWMLANVYNESKTEYDNWWDWEIGAPQPLNDTVALIYPRLTTMQVTNYLAAVNKFTPVPSMTAANLVDKSLVVAVRGCLVKDSAKMSLARDALSAVFPYVSSGDGFYTDGSFIQHDYHPYTGGYGRTVVRQIVPLLQLLSGSSWEVTDAAQTNVVRWIYDAFAPVIYKGALLDGVRGRGISRDISTSHAEGSEVITSMIRLAQVVPEPDASRFKQLAKYWIQSDTVRNFIYGAALPVVPLAKNILNDPAVVPATEPLGHYHFGRMDRVVHLRPGFGVSLALSSSRIANYEAIGGENLRGWYTGDGLVQLYNNDLLQYENDFWPTVNPYRLPGTTVDTQSRADSSGQSYLGAYSWVGGAALENYGSVGMQLDAWNSTLTAKKSWFMVDDEIICLGAGITSSDNRTIETIVENRKLATGGTNVFRVNGVVQPATLGWTGTLTNTTWAALVGNAAGADLGYYFPGGANVRALREQRTGAWSNINALGASTAVSNNFLTLWFDHGVNPAAASYAYVLLPNRNAAQVAAYAASPTTLILTNDTWAQGVVNAGLGLTAVNFWNDGTNSLGGITVDRKASVIARRNAGTFSVAVADPTQVGSNAIHVTLACAADALVSADAGVTVVQLAPQIKLAVNAAGAGGKSLCATFAVPSHTISFDAIADQVTTNTVVLSATASSGLPVDFELVSGTNATLVGNVLSFTGAGSVSVRALQPGNEEWVAAAPVTNTFVVSKTPSTITLDGLAQTYNGSGLVITPTAGQPGLTLAVTYNGSPVAPVNAGSYQVIVTIQNAMYQGCVTGTLMIAKADQTLSFGVIADQQTTNVVQLSATAGSGLPVAYSVVSGPAAVNGTRLTFSNTGVVCVAASQGGNGNWNAAPAVTNSFMVSITAQVINFAPIADQMTTNALSLSATASSGLPVSYELVGGGQANLVGRNLTFTGEGTVSVRALQPGNALWSAAEPVTNTFAVTKTSLSITLGGLNQSFTGGGLVITPTTGHSGLTMQISYDGSPTAPVNAGTYTVVALIQDGIYQGSATGTLIIARGSQSITFPAIADQYVTNEVALAATASSGLPVSFAVVSGPALWDGTTLTFTNFGSVSITATQSGNSNWLAAPLVTRTFNVALWPQTINFPTPGDKSLTNTVRLSATASSGLPVSFSIVDGPGVLTGGTNLTFNGVGPVSIVASQNGAGEWTAATPVTNTINVAPYPSYTKPDFQVASIVTTPATLTLGCTFSAVVTVRNSGTILGNAGRLKVWANHSATATTSEAGDASQSVGNLAVGATSQLTFTGLVAPAVAGTYYVRAFVDGTGQTPESSDGNNQLTLKYVLQASGGGGGGGTGNPDFTITAITLAPTALTNNCKFAATVTVKNQGSAAGNAGALKLWLNHGATATTSEPGDVAQAAGTLAAGASASLTFTNLTAPAAAGTYYLRAFVDGNNATAESSEGNNQNTLAYTVASAGGGGGGSGGTGKPDFTVTALSIAPTALTNGNTFTATVTVKNQGAGAGDAGVLKLWLNHGATATTSEPGDAAQAAGTLAAGASMSLTFANLTAPAAAGSYYLRAFVDGNNATVESSEGNNQSTMTYSVTSSGGSGGGGGGGTTAKPDFIVTAISFSPASLTLGCTFTAYITIVNNSTVAGNAGALDVYLNRGATATVGLAGNASQTIGTLAAGETRIVTFTGLTAPAIKGTYYFRAFVDSQGVTVESSEGNNQKTKTYGFY